MDYPCKLRVAKHGQRFKHFTPALGTCIRYSEQNHHIWGEVNIASGLLDPITKGSGAECVSDLENEDSPTWNSRQAK